LFSSPQSRFGYETHHYLHYYTRYSEVLSILLLLRPVLASVGTKTTGGWGLSSFLPLSLDIPFHLIDLLQQTLPALLRDGEFGSIRGVMASHDIDGSIRGGERGLPSNITKTPAPTNPTRAGRWIIKP